MDQSETQRAIALLGNARLIYVGATLFLYLINHEDHFQRLRADLFPTPDNSTDLARHDGSMYEIKNYGPLVEQLRSNNKFNLEYQGILIQSTFMNIGNELAKHDYFDKTPELEFFRHIRNALGHGNKFNLRGKEPIRPASFRGRTITRDLNGQPVFFKFMCPGDAFDLIDHLENHLRKMS